MGKLRTLGIRGVALVAVASFVLGVWIGGHLAYESGYIAAETRYTGQDPTAQRAGDPGFTGMDVWEELNNYRISKGLPAWELDEVLCLNISERAQQLALQLQERGYINHDGLTEFRDEQVRKGLWPSNMLFYELQSFGYTPQEVVEGWAGSPSHYMGLTSTETTKGCAYAWSVNALLFTR